MTNDESRLGVIVSQDQPQVLGIGRNIEHDVRRVRLARDEPPLQSVRSTGVLVTLLVNQGDIAAVRLPRRIARPAWRGRFLIATDPDPPSPAHPATVEGLP